MKIMGPAGNREAFDAALAAGADEIYMGLAGYGARQFAANFSPDAYCAALDDAHRYGTAIHLTLNTLMSEAEIDRVAPDVNRLYAAGLDGVIVQDFGVADWVRKNFPQLPIHASTQMALANHSDVAWAERNGFSRVVLPRELSFEEIAAIRHGTTIELEVFVSGALCLACSGKCYLSSFIGGRSGNRGSCAQPCRQYYDEVPPSVQGTAGGSGYRLSLTDQLAGPDEITRLAEIGVGAIKIEGRMKSPVYVYEAVRYYRQMLDRFAGILPEVSRKMFVLKNDASPGGTSWITDPRPRLASLFNRGYSTGYLGATPPTELLHPEFATSLGEPVGHVAEGVTTLTATIRCGDGIVYLDEAFKKLGGGNVSRIERLKSGRHKFAESCPEGLPGERVRLDPSAPAEATQLFRSFNHTVEQGTRHAIENVRRHQPITLQCVAKIGLPLEIRLILRAERICPPSRRSTTEERLPTKDHKPFSSRFRYNLGETTVKLYSDQPLEASRGRRMTADELRDALDRFGTTPFVPIEFSLDFDETVFIPKSVINSVRQQASEQLEAAQIAQRKRLPAVMSANKTETFKRPASGSFDGKLVVAAAVRTKAQALAVKKFGIETIYYLSRPVQFESERERFESAAGGLFAEPASREPFTISALAGSIAEAEFYQRQNIPFAADSTWNIVNHFGGKFCFNQFSSLRTLYLSPELSQHAIKHLAAEMIPDDCTPKGDKKSEKKGMLRRIGMVIYGHLAAMTTRVALLDSPRGDLTDAQGRRFTVEQNRIGFAEEKTLPGSTVYGSIPRDVTAAAAELLASGVTELRFDFPLESPDEIQQILRAKLPRLTMFPDPGTERGFVHPIF